MDIRRRRVLQLDVGSAVVAALPFLFSLAHAANQPPKVTLVVKSLVNEFFLTVENGAHKYQRDHASEYSLLTNGVHDETDTAGQIHLVEQMIVTHMDALVLAPADSKTLVPVVKKAVDTGILVINIDNRLDPTALKEKGLNAPFAGSDNRKGARLVGDFAAKPLKPGDAVSIIEGIPTTTNAQQRTADFKDAAEAAKLKTAGVQSGEWEVGEGNRVAAAMLRFGPDLKALLCDNDGMTIGVISTMRAAGKLSKVLIGGYDDIDAIKTTLADGRVVAMTDQHANQQVVYDIKTALKALASRAPQTKLSGVVETPVNLVTRS